MKNRKGFTLIEILTVILIIGLILLVSIPLIKIISNSIKTRSYNAKISLIEAAASEYGKNNSDFFGAAKEIEITANTLLANGYLTSDVNYQMNECEDMYGCLINPINNNLLNESIIIKTNDLKNVFIAEYGKRITYNLAINFDANGASSIGAERYACSNSNEESCSIKLPQITRDGYNILGWSKTDSNEAAMQVGDEIILDSSNTNTTYYAITSKTFTAIFDVMELGQLAEAEKSKSCTIYNKDESCEIKTPTIEDLKITLEDGYTIVWNEDKNATVASLNGISTNGIINLSSEDTHSSPTALLINSKVEKSDKTITTRNVIKLSGKSSKITLYAKIQRKILKCIGDPYIKYIDGCNCTYDMGIEGQLKGILQYSETIPPTDYKCKMYHRELIKSNINYDFEESERVNGELIKYDVRCSINNCKSEKNSCYQILKYNKCSNWTYNKCKAKDENGKSVSEDILGYRDINRIVDYDSFHCTFSNYETIFTPNNTITYEKPNGTCKPIYDCEQSATFEEKTGKCVLDMTENKNKSYNGACPDKSWTAIPEYYLYDCHHAPVVENKGSMDCYEGEYNSDQKWCQKDAEAKLKYECDDGKLDGTKCVLTKNPTIEKTYTTNLVTVNVYEKNKNKKIKCTGVSTEEVSKNCKWKKETNGIDYFECRATCKTSYKCSSGYKLSGAKCIKREDAKKITTYSCSSGNYNWQKVSSSSKKCYSFEAIKSMETKHCPTMDGLSPILEYDKELKLTDCIIKDRQICNASAGWVSQNKH